MGKIINDRRLWVVTIIIFVLLLTFFDRNNLLDRVRLRRQISELEQRRDYYLDKIAEDSLVLEMLRDDAFLEKYAREKYLMKKDGETVYVIVDK